MWLIEFSPLADAQGSDGVEGPASEINFTRDALKSRADSAYLLRGSHVAMSSVLPGDRWERVEKLFQEATELPPGAREKFIEERCGGDVKLRDEVLSLVRYDTGEQTTFGEALQAAAASLVADDAPGRRVGP